jgi:hypothetical protein
MVDKDAFEIRERALEDEFFHRVDEKLREELRRSMERDKSRESLTNATGLSDNDLLDTLIDAGFQATTLAALSLVPAIFVAWADDKVDQSEREQLQKAAVDHGIAEDGLAWQLLTSWIENKPPKSLWNTWRQYAEAVGKSLSPAASGILADQIVTLSTVVANASGGILGIGKISSKEREVIEKIKKALAS